MAFSTCILLLFALLISVSTTILDPKLDKRKNVIEDYSIHCTRSAQEKEHHVTMAAQGVKVVENGLHVVCSN